MLVDTLIKIKQNITENNNLKKSYWEKFPVVLKHDLYGGQKQVWKV